MREQGKQGKQGKKYFFFLAFYPLPFNATCVTVGTADGRCFKPFGFVSLAGRKPTPPTDSPGNHERQSLMGETTADASSGQSRREMLQAGKPVQRTDAPTHCLPLALASPKGRRPRCLTNAVAPLSPSSNCPMPHAPSLDSYLCLC